MSTKTLRKRIALVAVSALAAGLVSVAPANAANEGQIGTSAAAGSVGVLASTLAAATTTSTATVLSTGKLVLTSTGGASSYFVVSTGAYISAASAGTISSDQKKYTSNGANDTFSITPSGAVGSTFTVTGYPSSAMASVVSIVTVTIAGSSVAGTVSPADSYVAWTSDNTAATTDAADKNTATTGNALFLSIQLNDAYGADITSTSGALIATATSGASVVLGTGALSSNGTYTQAVSGSSPAQLYARVSEATAGAGWNGSVTITYNGTVIATKSGTISGAVAKITVAALKVGKNNGSATAASLSYQAYDAAGNAVVLPYANLAFSSSSNTAVVSTAAGSVVNTTSAVGNATFTCVSGGYGTSNLVLQTTLSNGTVVKSNSVAVKCGGAAATYTAAFDKASYVQGDLAKLTVSFKDANGAAANSTDTVTTWVSSTDLGRVITTPMLTAVDATPSASETVDANGQIVYTFTVGTTTGLTDGKYNAVISFPKENTAGANQTASYTVSSGASGTSNAAVLKAIVSLIASINKQIALLQKALLKK